MVGPSRYDCGLTSSEIFRSHRGTRAYRAPALGSMSVAVPACWRGALLIRTRKAASRGRLDVLVPTSGPVQDRCDLARPSRKPEAVSQPVATRLH